MRFWVNADSRPKDACQVVTENTLKISCKKIYGKVISLCHT